MSLLSFLCSLSPWLRMVRPDLCSEIAYFAYSVSGAGGETTSQEDIFAVAPRTGQVRRLTDDRANPVLVSDRNPVWSPDRRTLAIHRDAGGDPGSTLCLLSAADGATVRTLVAGVAPIWLDAATLLYLDGQGDVCSVDLATLVTQRITDFGGGVTVNGMSWHPSSGLALGWSEAGVRDSIARIPAGAVVAARAPGGSPVGSAGVTFVTVTGVNASFPDWSPAADRIALSTWEAGQPGRVGYLSLSSGAITLLPGEPPPGTGLLSDHDAVFSPDGGAIAWVRGFEDTWTEIWLADLVVGTTRRLTDEGGTRFKAGLDW
jgi:WD40-like Beta Propeller Repeat